MTSRSSAELTSTPSVMCVDHPGSKVCPDTVGVPSMTRIGITPAEPVELSSGAVYDGRMRITL